MEREAHFEKLLVWITSTVLLCFDKIGPTEWITLAIAYVGTVAFLDAAIRWKIGKVPNMVKTVVNNVAANKEIIKPGDEDVDNDDQNS